MPLSLGSIVNAISYPYGVRSHTDLSCTDPETLDPTFDDKWDIREPVIKPGHDMGDVTSWLYKGNRLPAAPPTIDNNSTDLEITSYYFNRALQSGHNDVLQIVDAHAEKKVYTAINRSVDNLINLIIGDPPSSRHEACLQA